MQGISNMRHARLNKALLQLEEIMLECGLELDAMEVRGKRQQIAQSFDLYIQLLEKLSVHILQYEELHDDIRINTVNKRLVKLKKTVKPVSSNFLQLREAIASYYGA